MDVYCTKCGKKAAEEHVKCINCGTDLFQEKAPVTAAPSKSPLTQKQKMTRGVIIALLAIIIGGSLWGNKQYSAESVWKKFNEAIASPNAVALEKLVVHEDGTDIQAFEAEALAMLAKEDTEEIPSYAKVVPAGKFLGIFKRFQVELPNQYAYFNGSMGEFAFSFNKEKVASKTDDSGRTSIGPVIPGIYKVAPLMEGLDASDYEVTLYLDNSAYDEEWLNNYFPIANVYFGLSDFNEDLMQDVKFIIGDKEIPMEDPEIEGAFGSFLIDGSQSVKVAAAMPWGEVVSEEIPIDIPELYLDLPIISDEEFGKIMEVIKNFGEQESEAYANKTTASFENISKEVRQEIAVDIEKMGSHYKSSKFEKVAFNRDSLELVEYDKTSGVQVSARFYFDSSIHDLSDEPSFYGEVFDRDFVVLFNKEKSSWEIDSFDSTSYWSFNPTDELEGSAKLNTPNSELVAASKAAEEELMSDQEMENFLNDYHSTSVSAINGGNFSIVADLYTPDAPAGKEAESYIDYLVEKGITEKHLGTTVEKVESTGDNWTVTSIDEYIIYYKDGTESQKKFRSLTTVKEVNGQLKMHELLSTEEL